MNGLRIIKDTSGLLILDRSRLACFFSLVFYIVFFSFWYYTLSGFERTESLEVIIFWLFFLAPLLFAKKIIDDAISVIKGDRHQFIKSSKLFINRGKVVARFAQIRNITITESTRQDSANSYELSLELHNKSISIEFSKSVYHIENLAKKIARITDAPIEKVY
ncbi:hypothetical protein [Pleionea sp. CnH1-48]|uniref:hypothetical protein n=1 Tax=Pleionea sp. CnH1-48 TaxID=2954494 RepID=UPI002097C44E|nr:hypothetical protein [Pleionea sp. CnH1-48]MCO7223362.1 hypothetical protein [Pleionea sp. CnH1-48]